jgi:hypothetical protein
MKKTQIELPDPCNADWNTMTHIDNGKFCSSCNKAVIDFTTWDVKEIIRYLESKNEKTCGHFTTLQVATHKPKHHQYLFNIYQQTEKKITIPVLKKTILSIIIVGMIAVGCERPKRLTGCPVQKRNVRINIPAGASSNSKKTD